MLIPSGSGIKKQKIINLLRIIALNAVKPFMNIDKRIHEINKTYFCQACIFVFTIHSKLKIGKTKPYCPNCAENIPVVVYVSPIKKQEKQRLWTDEELILIDRLINGELMKYQVAMKLKRSEKSIRNKLAHRRKELKLNESIRDGKSPN